MGKAKLLKLWGTDTQTAAIFSMNERTNERTDVPLIEATPTKVAWPKNDTKSIRNETIRGNPTNVAIYQMC